MYVFFRLSKQLDLPLEEFAKKSLQSKFGVYSLIFKYEFDDIAYNHTVFNATAKLSIIVSQTSVQMNFDNIATLNFLAGGTIRNYLFYSLFLI